jgi:uncharacterized membrane protein YjjB (DUF3815 family)
MLTSPALLISSILATVWACFFHLLLGRRLSDLILYWFVGLVGFVVGQAMGQMFGFRWLLAGQVHLIEGTLACWTAMLIARWLKV